MGPFPARWWPVTLSRAGTLSVRVPQRSSSPIRDDWLTTCRRRTGRTNMVLHREPHPCHRPRARSDLAIHSRVRPPCRRPDRSRNNHYGSLQDRHTIRWSSGTSYRSTLVGTLGSRPTHRIRSASRRPRVRLNGTCTERDRCSPRASFGGSSRCAQPHARHAAVARCIACSWLFTNRTDLGRAVRGQRRRPRLSVRFSPHPRPTPEGLLGASRSGSTRESFGAQVEAGVC